MEENNNFLYKGYLLVIEPYGWYWSAECKELDYDNTGSSIPSLKEYFKQFVDKKLDKEKEMTEQELYNYNGYLLTIKPVSIEHDLCGFIGIASFGDTIFRRFIGDSAKEVKEKFISYIEKNQVFKTVNKETFKYKGFTLDIEVQNTPSPTNNIYFGCCEEISFKTFGYFIKSRLIDIFKNTVDEKLEDSKTVDDKDKKIAKLVEVIDVLNKKLEEKDKKMERLKSKIATVKFEINKAE